MELLVIWQGGLMLLLGNGQTGEAAATWDGNTTKRLFRMTRIIIAMARKSEQASLSRFQLFRPFQRFRFKYFLLENAEIA
jgi:hypothetical protein